MSILNRLFGSATPPAAPTPAPVSNNPAKNPEGHKPEANAVVAPNGVVPENSAESPLDKFKDLWQPNENKQEEAPQGIDPAKLLEAASKVDFTKHLDQATLAKVSAGGEEAIAALVAVLNKSSQSVYGQSMVTTAKIVEQAVRQAEESFAAKLPEVMRNQGAKDKVFDENPAFAHPAIKPLIEAQMQQLAVKFPKASTAELTALAKESLTGMANMINPPKADASAPKTSKDEDWASYFK